MKIYFKVFLFLLIGLFFSKLSAQGDPQGLIEGYYINPVKTKFGIIATDDFESTLYLINGSKIKKLVSAPGCGRYFTISKDENKIGFKFINPTTGDQTPALIELKTLKILKLHEPVKYAGQVTFSDNGKIAYTIKNKLYVIGKETKEYDLEVYSNWTPISPDGKNVIYKDNDDQLWNFSLEKNSKTKITDDIKGYYSVKWSPDNNNLAYNSIDGKIFLYNLIDKTQSYVDQGEEVQWSPDGKTLVYYKRDIDFINFKTINSDIYEFDIIQNSAKNLTNTPDLIELHPNYIDEHSVIFNNFNTDEIVEIKTNNFLKPETKVLFKKDKDFSSIKYFNEQKQSLRKTNNDLDRWVHIHQVFDTRDNGSWTNFPGGKHQGYRCCGAASAMEVIASYKILPSWPFYTHSHTSNYGKYISDEFKFKEFVFNGFSTGSTIGFPTGLHGYMWNNGSPYSNTVSLLKMFDISAERSDNPSWSKIKKELDAGYPYILCSTSLTSGHIVVAIGQYEESHSLICNDPYGDKNVGSYGQIRNGKQAVYDWADANTGHMKISPVVWGITARYTPDLQIVQSSPEDGDTFVSSNTCPTLIFDAPVDTQTVYENISLTDDIFNEVPVEISWSGFQNKQLIIIPKENLKPGKSYNIKIKKELSDIYNSKMISDSTITFKVSENLVINGKELSSFENVDDYDFTTKGINDSVTTFVISNKEKIKGNGSAKITYEFSSQSGSYFRLIYKNKINLGVDPDSSFGIWLLGDGSMNSFELWFNQESGMVTKGLSGVINWVGWKLLNIDLDEIDEGKNVSFNSLAVRPGSSGKIAGTIYIDDAVKYKSDELYTDVAEINNEKPEEFLLSQNYPNPFNPSTNIRFKIPEEGQVSLKVFNLLGQLVKTVISDENLAPKIYEYKLDMNDLAGGVYFYSIMYKDKVQTKKMILIK